MAATTQIHGRWKVLALRFLAVATPLRWRPVRRAALQLRRASQRSLRRAAERRGRYSRSRPAAFDMDGKLEAILPSCGYFVEAGANDGYTQSNTYYLERVRGWRGLLIEPVPELFEQARRERTASSVQNYALVAPEQSGSLTTMRFAGLMSIVAGVRGDADADREYVDAAFALGANESYEVSVEGKTLSELLSAENDPEIDLLSLDLEGYEHVALRGLDLDRHQPRFILLEAETDERAAELGALLGERYRQRTRLSPMDVLFERA
jgi:FkbM family methyltransferase